MQTKSAPSISQEATIMPDFRKPVWNEQQVLCPPPMVAFDLRIWVAPAAQLEQRSYKVWCPDTDEMLALVVYPDRSRQTLIDQTKWLNTTYRSLVQTYLNPDPF